MNGLLGITRAGSMSGMADSTRGDAVGHLRNLRPQNVAIARKSPKIQGSAASHDVAVGHLPVAHPRGRLSGTPEINASLHFAYVCVF